ncbi:Virulence protein [Planctomycetes bacterium Pan216]|uniref:Virulence protein n=1 Tax=Kolteria novifilia TaxID=2527975 RepID=A0A518AXH5_9BACT|nr:Virulence protein [Planctomycetes bacterium Pan216]
MSEATENLSPAVTIESLDHLVLTVSDLDATIAFYTRVLGMEAVTFGAGRRALRFGRQKINLHEVGHLHPPVAAQAIAGSADLCLLTSTPLTTVARHLDATGTPIIEGPVRRTGATGPIESLYVRDPDGNLLEIAHPMSE